MSKKLSTRSNDRSLVWDALQSTGCYNTPADRRLNPFSKLPGRSALYHAVAGSVVYETCRLAKNGPWTRETWGDCAYAVLDVVESFGGCVHIEGVDHLEELRKGPAVFISNHMSLLETFLLPLMLLPYTDVTYVIKRGLKDLPFFRDIMDRIGAVAVGRENPRDDLKAVLGEGAAVLGSGRSVILFPQSTRAAVFDPDAFNRMGVKLAKKAGVPVVPLALRTDFLENGRLIKEMGLVRPDRPIHFAFGTPFRIEGNGRDEHAEIVEFISMHLKSWGGRVASLSSDEVKE